MPAIPADATALVIGEALVDVVHPADGSAPRSHPGGSPANVALGLSRLGRKTRLATWLGDDENGRTVLEHLRGSGVEVAPEFLQAAYTSTATATLDAAGSADYSFHLEWAPPEVTVAPTDVVVETGSLAVTRKPGAEVVQRAIAAARRQATVVYDPNARPDLMGTPRQAMEWIAPMIEMSDVVKVSDQDIAWLMGSGDIHRIAADWLSRGPSLMIVTQSSAGVEAWSRSGAYVMADADDSLGTPVVDTLGAGDSFTSAMIDRLWELDLLGAGARGALAALSQADLEEVCAWANKAAGVTVRRAGANPPTRAELN